MFKILYLNINPSAYVFLMPWNQGSTPPIEVAADAAGNTGWFHAIQIAFSRILGNVAGAGNGKKTQR